jgi:hypothetical protein
MVHHGQGGHSSILAASTSQSCKAHRLLRHATVSLGVIENEQLGVTLEQPSNQVILLGSGQAWQVFNQVQDELECKKKGEGTPT